MNSDDFSIVCIGTFNSTNNSSITWKYVTFENNIWSSIENWSYVNNSFFICINENDYFRYRKTTTENNADADDDDNLGRNKAEIESDHDSNEIDYPDDEAENDGDWNNFNAIFFLNIFFINLMYNIFQRKKEKLNWN